MFFFVAICYTLAPHKSPANLDAQVQNFHMSTVHVSSASSANSMSSSSSANSVSSASGSTHTYLSRTSALLRETVIAELYRAARACKRERSLVCVVSRSMRALACALPALAPGDACYGRTAMDACVYVSGILGEIQTRLPNGNKHGCLPELIWSYGDEVYWSYDVRLEPAVLVAHME